MGGVKCNPSKKHPSSIREMMGYALLHPSYASFNMQWAVYRRAINRRRVDY
jgi:hypothetical protein